MESISARLSSITRLLSTGVFWLMLSAGNTAHTADSNVSLEASIAIPEDSLSPVLVAVVDDAFNTDHPVLQPHWYTNVAEIPFNQQDDDNNGFVDDFMGWDAADEDAFVTAPQLSASDFYHGNYIAGILLELVESAVGERATEALRILPVKAASDQALPDEIRGGYQGIQYAINQGADIIVTAWSSKNLTQAERSILRYAKQQDVLIIASAGNEYIETSSFPAADRNVIAVAAVDENNQPLVRSNHGQFVDLSARGENIFGLGYHESESQARSGTSPATGRVAGVFALVKMLNPSLSNIDVLACVVNSTSSVNYSNPALIGKFGSGVVDVKAAVACASGEGPSAPTEYSKTSGYILLNALSDDESKELVLALEPENHFNGIVFTLPDVKGASSEVKIDIPGTHTGSEQEFKPASLSASNPEVDWPLQQASIVSLDAKPGSEPARWLHYRTKTKNFSKEFCNGTVNVSSEGAINDGSNGQPYAYYSDCQWVVKAPAGKLIEVETKYLGTEPNVDKLQFFDGAVPTTRNQIAMLSGSKLPPLFRSWSSEMLIWFLSDAERQFDGWEINIKFVDAQQQ